MSELKDKAITLYIENYEPGKYDEYIRGFINNLTQSVVTQFAIMSLNPDGSGYKLRIFKDGVYDRTITSLVPTVFKSIIYRLLIIDPSYEDEDNNRFMILFNIMKTAEIPAEIIRRDHVLTIGNDDTNKFSNKMISVYVPNFSTTNEISILSGMAWNSMIESYNLKNIMEHHRTVFLLDYYHTTLNVHHNLLDIVNAMEKVVRDEIIIASGEPVSGGYGWMSVKTLYPQQNMALWIKGTNPGENISVINQFQLTDYENGDTSKGVKTDIYAMSPNNKYTASNIFIKAHTSNLFSDLINAIYANNETEENTNANNE